MSNADSPSPFPFNSPVAPQDGPAADASFADLLFRPRRFYASSPAWLRHPATLPGIALVAGMATAVGRLERMMMRTNPGDGATMIASSWPILWALLLVSGTMSAALLWTIGVWWYRVRLRWSGAPDVDRESARDVYFPAILVSTAPTILVLAWATARYPNYGAYWEAPASVGDMLLLIFPFWSVWIGYRGVRQRFAVSRGRARVWFLGAPAAVFIIIFDVVGAVATLTTPANGP